MNHQQIIDDLRAGDESIKEASRHGWGVFVIAAFFAAIIFFADHAELLRGAIGLVALNMYFQLKWAAVLDRRLLLANRLLQAIALHQPDTADALNDL